MAQHDGQIDDQYGASFLVDLNALSTALLTNHSGPTAPAPSYAYQWWADTSTGLLKQRNGANDGWLVRGPLADWGIQTGAQIVASASGTADALTASFTPAITTLSAGLTLRVRAALANASATPTFTPNSGAVAAKTIVKGANQSLAAGDIAGAGHWLTLQYDATLDKWVLGNPARGVASGLTSFATGVALPTSNIGPIWHDDYNSVMTWQAFTANGATYTGYASVLVGSLLLETQPTPRPGYVKSGVTNLSKTAYAALRGWAMHNGIMVASGVWAAGTIAVSDNVDGTTFKLYDVRGEFPRFWDDGRGVDAGRAFGSAQADANKSHSHHYRTSNAAAGVAAAAVRASTLGDSAMTTESDGDAEARPRNVALLACIKY